VSFQLSWQTALFFAVLEITAGFFSMFLWAKKYIIRFSAHCRVRTKKLINIKVRKMSILAMKCTFLGQNRLNIYNQLWMRMFPILDILNVFQKSREIVKW
jgi:hypothetical protein